MSVLWHPDALRYPVKRRPGKPFSGGSGKVKLVLHSTETGGLPSYTSPPHITADFHKVAAPLWQHIPFDLAAYSIRSSRAEELHTVIQVELIGRAHLVPDYPDLWYQNLASFLEWCHQNLEVPLSFADFTIMRYGRLAPQRMRLREVDDFTGILGHAHVGRFIDTHWNPGRLDVPRLKSFLKPHEPPPPPPTLDVNMAYADTLTTTEWVATLRNPDIDQLFDLGVHSPDTPEARNYWKTMRTFNATPQWLEAWENFRRTTSARIGFWQP